MGALQIDKVELVLTNRTAARYTRLFTNDKGTNWNEGLEPTEQNFAGIFEEFLLSATSSIYSNVGRAADLPPLKELLTMMAWRGDDPGETWLEGIRYMEIERGTGKLNEFKERPVLPTPLEVINWASGTPSNAPESQPGRGIPDQTQSVWPPKKGAVLIGNVLDDEPHGKVYLTVISAEDQAIHYWLQKNAGLVEIVAEILPKHRAGKSYREGTTGIRLIVLSANEDSSGWLIECRPGN